MFKLKKILNFGNVAPDLIRVDSNTAYSFADDILPGMAICLKDGGSFVRCDASSSPTHICDKLAKDSLGEPYMLCFAINENMVFEAPFISAEGSEDAAIGSPVFVADGAVAVKFDKNNTQNTGVIVCRDYSDSSAAFERVLVRFPLGKGA